MSEQKSSFMYTSSRPAQIFIQIGSLNGFYNIKQTVYDEPYKTD